MKELDHYQHYKISKRFKIRSLSDKKDPWVLTVPVPKRILRVDRS